ncbi:ROK family protein [Patescibacteria group bacterium]
MYVSIDLGGTNTRVASSRDLKDLYKQEKFQTDQDLHKQLTNIIESIKIVVDGETPQYIVVGVPGIVNKKERKLERIINVPSLSNLTFSELVGNSIEEKNIFVENDASLAGLGEAVNGAGKNFEVVVYMTLSTGVGGVRIAGKKIDEYQRHSEPGHMIIQRNGRTFGMCDQKGCLSAYCSGTAFEEIYGESPVTCKDENVWEDYSKNLALGISNIMAMWSPDIIVLGGSLSNKFEEFFEEPLLKELNRQKIFKVPEIKKSVLGDSAGLIGGFVLLFGIHANIGK